MLLLICEKSQKAQNFSFSRASLEKEFWKRQKKFKCSFPFKQLVINNEKKILPCCTFWGEELELQELNKPEDLITAWNSKKMNFLRDKHLKGEYHQIPQCSKCIDG